MSDESSKASKTGDGSLPGWLADLFRDHPPEPIDGFRVVTVGDDGQFAYGPWVPAAPKARFAEPEDPPPGAGWQFAIRVQPGEGVERDTEGRQLVRRVEPKAGHRLG
jgi:hypothetical protein